MRPLTYTEQELIEIFEERAAIREYEAGMSRSDAEKAAYFDWRKIVGKEVKVPDEIRKIVAKFRSSV